MTQKSIQAAINGQGQYASKTYFFKGNRYVRYDWETEVVESGYPQPLSAWGFGGAFESGIDAALNGSAAYAGKAYFFKGSQYLRYDWATDSPENGYPQPLSAWGLTGVFAGGIDCALEGAGPYGGRAYFFKGNQYTRYDWAADKLDSGYPQPLSAWKLSGEFAGGIDAAVNGIGQYAGKAYFFKSNQYVRYDWATDTLDSGYPQNILGNWSGLMEALGGAIPLSPGGTSFAFTLQEGESVNQRVVRCCSEALAGGPMGQNQRHDFYRDFISCRQESTPGQAEPLTAVRTSCAMFVRAVRQWCGAPPVGHYVPGTGMFVSMGNVSLSHPAFVRHNGQNIPHPGDYFYIAPPPAQDPNGVKGHTGIFIEQLNQNEWRTAEGGGGDGTTCQFTARSITGNKFANDDRLLLGWFDCTRVGIPSSP
jgi:hypothetical protein